MAASMNAESQARGPVSKQCAFLIDGVKTDIVCTDYEDRLFLVITQLQKLGTLIHVSKDTVVERNAVPTYTVHVLLGKDDEMLQVLARSLASKIPVQKPILVAVALKDTSVKVLKAVEKLVVDKKVWDCNS